MTRLLEHDEQAFALAWARAHSPRYPHLHWLFAITNGAKLPYMRSRKGKRYAPQALRLKAEGLLPGVCDLFWPYASHGFHGLFIEVKIGDNRVTDAQAAFIRAMNAAGYLATVCYGGEQVVRTLCCYGDLEYDLGDLGNQEDLS